MDNFIFSLEATMPVFLVMVVGYFLRRIGMLNESFCAVANKYVFKVALPLLLFKDIAETDLRTDFNLTFVLYCMIVTTVMFLGIWALTAWLMPDKSLVGAFSQAAARSSAAVLGIAFVENIYGNAGLTPMMIVAAVPLFNIYSVIILTFSAQHRERGGGAIRTACINVLKNPIILGILAGLPFSLFGISIPTIPLKTITSISNTATPIAGTRRRPVTGGGCGDAVARKSDAVHGRDTASRPSHQERDRARTVRGQNPPHRVAHGCLCALPVCLFRALRTAGAGAAEGRV